MKLLLLATVALGLTLVDGYSRDTFTRSVDKEFACKNLYPNHSPAELKIKDSPYSLTVTDSGNGKRKVTISGSPAFMGFILQAKSSSGGAFESPSKKIINVDCDQGPTIRHENPDPKESFTVTWNTPGAVTFEGAVVEDLYNFYKIKAVST